ncbi:MAG TPA: Sua5/YciO/YrdC/YwlC family protein, partial [Egibacteraceae bacterium]|nr:Sua5/YciO/YrdC/YwlC family protein [Egibacteraceae bacterium]
RQAPLSVLIRSPRQVGGLAAEIPEAAERLMASYWPGPLTLIFRAQEGLTWYLGESEGAVALRMPTDDLTLSIVAEIGPLAATLASKLGMPLPSTGQEAQGLLRKAVQVYVEGGRREQEPSTIVDVTREGAVILRRGAIPAAHVEQVASGAVGWGQRPGDAGPAAETDAEAAADDLMQERAGTARPEAETEVADADRDRG